MILLPNGCNCSGKAGDPDTGIPDELSVNPKNWKTVKASVKTDWYIQYYFRDPVFKEQYPKGMFKLVKGMNVAKTVKERRMLTENIMQSELYALKVEGYNPITNKSTAPTVFEQNVGKYTLWIKALETAYKLLKISTTTMSEIKYVCSNMAAAAKQLHIDQFCIKDIMQVHVECCLEQIQKTKSLETIGKKKKQKTWGPASFNRHRSYLIMTFKQLIKMGAIANNPATDIEKQQEPNEPREELSNEDAIIVDQYLRKNFYSFWRYMQIFHCSGGRKTELSLLQAKDVDLIGQTFTVMSKKGRNGSKKRNIKTKHTISNTALPFWKEVMQQAKPDDYVFSAGLVPGEKPINPAQINRRWLKVKIKFGITADFYAFKHKFLDKITEKLGYEDAAGAAGHADTQMVKKIYARKEKERQAEKRHERLKTVDVKFLDVGIVVQTKQLPIIKTNTT